MSVTNVTAGDPNFMQIYAVNATNQANIYPLITNNSINTFKAYRSDVPVIKLGEGPAYIYAPCNGKLTNLGCNNTSSPYYEFDNSIAKYSTMFLLSFYSDWTNADGLNKIVFENPITGDSVVMDNLASYTKTQGLLNGYNSNSLAYGNVLAIGFKELATWTRVRIKFYALTIIHVWAGFKSIGVGDKFAWDKVNKYLIKDKNSILYTYNGTTIVQSPSQVLEDNNFKNNGISDPSAILSAVWDSAFPDKTGLKLLTWTDYTSKTSLNVQYDCDSYIPWDKLFLGAKVLKYDGTDITVVQIKTGQIFLLQDGSKIKFSSDGITITADGLTPFTDDNFKNHGMKNLLTITPTVINQLENNKYKFSILRNKGV